MDLCKYGLEAGCTECTHLIWRNCSLFVKHHVNFLISDLGKFTFLSKIAVPTKQIVFSKNERYIKSAALRYAVVNNVKILRLPMSQAMNIATQFVDVPSMAVYIDMDSPKESFQNMNGVGTLLISSVNWLASCNIQVFIYYDASKLGVSGWFPIDRDNWEVLEDKAPVTEGTVAVQATVHASGVSDISDDY